jgi:hypothetical protein
VGFVGHQPLPEWGGKRHYTIVRSGKGEDTIIVERKDLSFLILIIY